MLLVGLDEKFSFFTNFRENVARGETLSRLIQHEKSRIHFSSVIIAGS